ncbi:MAG: phage late control D family protein [Gammaproteobacteria bacterium]
MQPIFCLYADSQEITAAIRDRLIEMMVTDEAGIQSDELKLTLDDRRREDGAIAQLPRIGTVLTVSMGYAETRLVAMGKFIVDEIEIRSPPATLSVSAKAADMVGPFRSPKTRSWDATTLGKLVETIAGEHGYTPKVDPELGAIPIPHLDQTEESDMALLTRLAAKHDAVVKPVAGFLVLARQGAAKTITGQTLPTLRLEPEQLAQWRYQHSARKPAGTGSAQGENGQSPPEVSTGGARAYWWDFEKGERREVTTGSPPYEEIRYVHATEAEAKAAAATRKNTGERGQGELSFSLPGDPRLAAEGRLSINLRPGIPTDWRIKRVEHRLGAQGYTTQVECERFTAAPVPITATE